MGVVNDLINISKKVVCYQMSTIEVNTNLIMTFEPPAKKKKCGLHSTIVQIGQKKKK